MKTLTDQQVAERLILLYELKHEIERERKSAMNAPDDEYKEGYKKAMTNVLAIINEEIRITNQHGDPTIKVQP